MANFWLNSKNPFYILAPMEDVTDTVFREVVMSVSDPEVLNVLYTEFTSTDGLMDTRGFEKVSIRLKINESELELIRARGTKLVAQIWGTDPAKFLKTAQMLTQSGNFDGIDINMGCPVKKVVKKGSCSALIKNPDLASEIINATKEGTHLPVSVKTRIGFNTVVTEEWVGHLLNHNLDALILHGRTQKMQSDGLADWEEIAKASVLRDSMQKDTAIIGNGDVDSYSQGEDLIAQHNLEGVMVGRGIFKNPWMFNKSLIEPACEQRINLLSKHISLFQKTWEGEKNFNILKRFFKIYINSFRGAAEYRAVLMNAKNYSELSKAISNFSTFIE